MMVLLPFAVIALILDGLVCAAASFSGWMLLGMALLLFLAFFAASLAVYVAFLGVLALGIDLDKPQKTHSPFFSAVAKYTMGLLVSLAGARIHLSGEDKIPEGRWLLVSNHRSAFDPLLTIWALRKHTLAFVSKPSNLKIPIFGKIAHKIGCLALDREDDRAALRTILTAAEQIKNDVTSFCIYPEGTRNTEKELLPFRNGAFKIAQRAKVPIVVMTVENTENIRKNFPFRRTKVELRIREVISAERVAELKTPEIGEEVRRCMACESG